MEFSPNLVTLVVIVFVENCEICLEMAKTVTQTKVKYYTHTNVSVFSPAIYDDFICFNLHGFKIRSLNDDFVML